MSNGFNLAGSGGSVSENRCLNSLHSERIWARNSLLPDILIWAKGSSAENWFFNHGSNGPTLAGISLWSWTGFPKIRSAESINDASRVELTVSGVSTVYFPENAESVLVPPLLRKNEERVPVFVRTSKRDWVPLGINYVFLIVDNPTKSIGVSFKIKALTENVFILEVISFVKRTVRDTVLNKSIQLLLRPLHMLGVETVLQGKLYLSTSCWEIKSPASDPVSRSAFTSTFFVAARFASWEETDIVQGRRLVLEGDKEDSVRAQSFLAIQPGELWLPFITEDDVGFVTVCTGGCDAGRASGTRDLYWTCVQLLRA